MKANYVWALVRVMMGWIFLWAFLDKTFGLGFATEAGKGWLQGGSPTMGFLKFGTKGPFAEFFQSLAGNPLIDWLFMLGLLGIGTGLMLGIMMRLATIGGFAMLMLMYMAGFVPPEHNPLIDDHVVYAFVLLGLLASDSGDTWGHGKKWKQKEIVRKYPVLQ